MQKGKVKATVIKCVAAVLCCALVAYAGIANTGKICESKTAIAGGGGSVGAGSSENVNDEIDAQFADMESEESEENQDEINEEINGSAGTSSSETAGESTGGSASGNSGSASGGGTASKKITLTGGLNSTKKSEVLEYYKLVSKKNSKLLFTKTLSLISLNGGKSISQKAIDIFLPIAKKALAKNTVTDEPYPGKPEKITVADWQAAKAVNDGTYTTVYIKVVPQTDGINGSLFEGSAGRSMTVLDGVQRALQDMPGVTIDFNKTKMEIEYINPVIKLKVNNSTGELVKGECIWSYRTHPVIHYLEGKALAFTIHLEDADGYVDYSVKY